MEPRLIQQQSQKLILSPQIRQYLRLLQLPLTQLEQAVDAEVAENPVLEEKQADLERLPEEPLSPADPQVETRKASEEVRVGESFDHLDQVEDSFENTYEYPDFSRRDRRDLEDQKNFQDGLLTKTEGLSDFLMWQIRFLDFTETEKSIATEIIGNIDEDGYLRASVEEIAKACGADVHAAEKVLSKIQDLDPPGIAARNLQEALALQIQKKIRETAPEEKKNGHSKEATDSNGHSEAAGAQMLALKIVQHHLSLLEKRDWHALAKSTGAPEEEIRKAATVIAGLEPRPGRVFYSEESLAVRPDATVSFNEESGGEKFKIDIHEESIPEIRINPYYRRLLRSKNMDEKGRAFLKEKMQSAVNFLRAMKLRKSTLREITEEIVKAQPDFFEKGFLHLKPLRLKDIAQSLGIHESTVSRAIQSKYISTPQGMIPYKSFFSVKLESSNGMEESQKSIMEKIKQRLEKEDPLSPLSDQQIVQILKNDGIRIARRTVAKYRELLKILPSHMRRKK